MLSIAPHVFSEIFIHLNWHTKDDHPFLNPEMDPFVHNHIKEYCNKTKGIDFLCLGGTVNHLHLVIQMEPHITLADWVGQVKGSSSHLANEQQRRVTLQWQRGYGAVSFSRRDLPAVERYVINQKTHHAQQRVNKVLELFGPYLENEVEAD